MKMSATDHVGKAELLNVKNLWLLQCELKDSDRVNNGPVLPVKGEKNILVTSALPDVNNIPHLGDIGSVLSADVFARYCRSRGWNTLYVSGVNEHGTETEKKALEVNMTPQKLCDRYFEIHKAFYEWLNISFDKFGRTTSPAHAEFIHQIFSRVHKKGYTTTSLMACFFCKNCNRFSDDEIVKRTCPMCSFKDVLGHQRDGCDNEMNASKGLVRRCNICQETLVVYHSREVFLNLPKVETNLKNWVNKSTDGWSYNAQVISKSLMKDGLKKKCITRSSKWGISVLLEELESKVFCDWFATPLSYMSFTCEYSQKWNQWWKPKNDTKITYYQFIDKNDVPVHSVFFPGLLFATECKFTFVEHIIAKKYLKYKNSEFSKSHGAEIFGSTGLSSDVFRIYMILSECQEISFSWNNLVNTYNSKLFIHLGNFCNNTLSTTRELFDSTIPEIQLKKDDLILLALVTRHHKQYITLLDDGKRKDGLLQVLSISRLCNEYIADQLLWTLIKQSNGKRNKVRTRTVIGLCCNLVCLLAILLKPYMPETAIEIGKQMNIDLSIIVLNYYIPMFLGPGHKIGKGAPIFKCINNSLENKLALDFTGNLKNQKNQKVQTLKKRKLENKVLVVPVQDLAYITSIEQLEEAIFEQTNIIQILKRGNAEKNELELYIKGLLEMKRKLCQMKVSSPNPTYEHK